MVALLGLCGSLRKASLNRALLVGVQAAMPAGSALTLYGGLELFFGVTGSFAGVAHFAHLGGLAAGWLLIRYWRGQPPFPRR